MVFLSTNEGVVTPPQETILFSNIDTLQNSSSKPQKYRKLQERVAL